MQASTTIQHFLLATCLISVSLTGCNDQKKASAKGPMVSALVYLPADCSIAIHADLKALATNAVIKAHLIPAMREAFTASQKRTTKLAAFMDTISLDPFSDFHEFSACTGTPLSSDPEGIMTVTGPIAPGIVVAMIKESEDSKKTKVSEIKGQKTIGSDRGTITQREDGSLAGGNDMAMLVASADQPNAFADDFRALGDAAIRIVVPEKTVLQGLNMRSPFARITDKIDGNLTLALNLSNTTLTVKLAAVDETAATEIAAIARAFLGQVPTSGKGPKADLLAALAASKTSSEGKHFVMTIHLPAEQFEKGCKLIATTIRADLAK